MTLGRLALLSPSGEDTALLAQRQKLALLTVLALARRPLSRDVLVDMFWGEEDEERARHSLSNALSHLRKVLGAGAIASRQARVGLSEEARLGVDATELEAACQVRDFERAVALYEGPFLEDVYIASPRFEAWVDRERDRLRRLFVQACEARAQLLARAGRWEDSAALALRWSAATSGGPAAVTTLLTAGLNVPDPRRAAAVLADARRLIAARANEAGVAPDGRVAALTDQLAERVASDESRAARAAVSATAQVSATAPVSAPDERPAAIRLDPQTRPADQGESAPTIAPAPAVALLPRAWPRVARGLGRWAMAASGAVVVALVVAAVLGTFRLERASGGSVSNRAVVAVVGIDNVRGDTAAAWLGVGLQQMISSDLARSALVEVIDPSRVREVLARGGRGGELVVRGDEARDLGARLGASWVVTGGVTESGDGIIVLDVSVRDVVTGRLLRLFTITGSNAMAIADQAAARVLSGADESAPGAHFAEMETANLAAYQHYLRAEQAAAEGRRADHVKELDAAIATDSGFVSAIIERLRVARDDGDAGSYARLAALFARAVPRATEWDRLDLATYTAFRNGEHRRAEQLARALVDRFPHDPRSYSQYADVLWTHGKWSAADSVMQRALSLDSLAALAGDGPCVPCATYGALASSRILSGDLTAAEGVLRRWIALQPELPRPWATLADVLAYDGRYDAAFRAARRSSVLAGENPDHPLGPRPRLLLMARRLEEAEALLGREVADRRAGYRSAALDHLAMLQRERGQFRASSRTIRTLVAEDPSSLSLLLVHADNLARLGLVDAAIRLYESNAHETAPEPPSPIQAQAGDRARAFCWAHALLADAIAETADTVRLRALADSIEVASVRSYYARDWRLAHHVHGLIAMRAGRYTEAAREFEQARWGKAGWTRTNIQLAKAHLALGRADQAQVVLREAYAGPLDAMGRYVPRSEIDYWMAMAFGHLGQRDSAAVYAGYVRHAWRDADPEVRRLLRSLP